MKMFTFGQQEDNNALISTYNVAVKNSGLTFNAQGRRLILQKINAMRKLFAVIAATTIFLSCNKTVIHGEGNVVSAERNVSNLNVSCALVLPFFCYVGVMSIL